MSMEEILESFELYTPEQEMEIKNDGEYEPNSD